MTVGMAQLQQMNMSFQMAHRDFKVAQDVGKMIELRRFEIEFEVFATAYWEDGRRHYRVSKEENPMYEELVKLSLEEKFPLPLQVYRDRRLLPAGMEEEISTQVKVDCCKQLRDTYPEELWIKLGEASKGRYNDAAVTLLEGAQEKIEGLFDERLITMFETLVESCFLRRNLTPRSYRHFMNWVAEERQEMLDSVVERDIFSKVFYGIAYRESPDGPIKYAMDASQRTVAEQRRKLEGISGAIATPIYRRKFWYNYDYRLVDVRRDFKAELASLFDEKFFVFLDKMYALPSAIDQDAFVAECAYFEEAGLPECLEAWKTQGRRWGVSFE